MRSRTAARLGLAAAFVLLVAILGMPSTGGCLETAQTKPRAKWFKFPTMSQLGLIEVWGEITDSGPYIRQIRKFDKNPMVKGIILRIDSPGGEVGATQEIYNELIKYREGGKGDRVVVASFGGVAASGGYYLACAAERIFTNPGALTGSIGVKMEFFDAEDLMKKVGVRYSVIKSGRYKDIGNFSRQMNDEEVEILQSTINDVYQQFVDAVQESRATAVRGLLAKRRGIKAAKITDEDIREYIISKADGRVFSGRQAVSAGLADELGGLDDAIDAAAAMAGISGRPSIVTERRKSAPGWTDYIGGLLNLPSRTASAIRPARVSLKYTL